MSAWETWISVVSGVVTIAPGVAFLVRLIVGPMVQKMMDKQTADLTNMVNRRMTLHERRYHRNDSEGYR